MQDFKSLNDAYRLLAKAYSRAWAAPTEIPTPIAMTILHARDHIGHQIEAYLRKPEPTIGSDRGIAIVTADSTDSHLAA